MTKDLITREFKINTALINPDSPSSKSPLSDWKRAGEIARDSILKIQNQSKAEQVSEIALDEARKASRLSAEAIPAGSPLNLPKMGSAELKKRAEDRLSRAEEQIPVPDEIFLGATGWGVTKDEINRVRENYLQRRKLVFSMLAEGKFPFISTDADGTVSMKTQKKVEDSRSIGSLFDKHYLRLLVKALDLIGGRLEVNTARTGAIAGPSIMGTEGPAFQDESGKWVNPRITSEISSILHELGIHNLNNPDNLKVFRALTVNGLSGSVIHKPDGSPLQIKDSAIRYGLFLDQLNKVRDIDGAPEGFLEKLQDIVGDADNDGVEREKNPLRVLEFKSIPRGLLDNNLSTEQWLNFADTATRARKEKWGSEKFVSAVKALSLPLQAKYAAILDPKDPEVELKFTTAMRDGFIVCLTPHAMDAYTTIDDEKKLEMYRYFAKFARSPQVQEWANKSYGVPLGADLFTVNGKDVSHIDFDTLTNTKTNRKYNSLEEFVDDLKDKGASPEHPEFIFAKIIENKQPYCEIAPNSDKSDVLPPRAVIQERNYAVIGAGDSPGSDATLVGQAIIDGGAGFVVRGLMKDSDIGGAIAELLTKDKNQWHEFAMEDLGKNEKDEPIYKRKETGEIKTRSQWADILSKHYQDRVSRASNIHQNNVFNAAIFSELLEGHPEFSLSLPNDAGWAKDSIENKSTRDLSTPDVGLAKKITAKETYEKSPAAAGGILGLLAAMPLLKNIKVENLGPLFNKLFHFNSKSLMYGGAVGVVAKALGMEGLMQKAKYLERFAFFLNSMTSGISRGLLLSPHKFPWQFNGEMIGAVSALFKSNSVFGQTLRAFANSVLIGRGVEEAMKDGINLDEMTDDAAKQELKEKFGDKYEEYADVRKLNTKHTRERNENVRKLQYKYFGGVLGRMGGFGTIIAGSIADLWRSLVLTKEFFTVKGLRHGYLSTFFTRQGTGYSKISKNSGLPYKNVHSVGHAYAATGVMTMITAVASTVLGKLTGSEMVDRVLTNLANIIPSFGILIAGKQINQDAPGEPRQFTGVDRQQKRYSPEKAGFQQMLGGWIQALTAPFLGSDWGQLLFNTGTGFYLDGIRQQLTQGLDDSQANIMSRRGTYYKEDEADVNRGDHIDAFTRKFHLAIKEPSSPIKKAA